MKPLEAVSCEYKRGGHYCNEHRERVKMYCFGCHINVCSMCCLESHKTHKFERIDIVAQKFARSIDDEIERVTSSIECFRGNAAHVEAESAKLFRCVQATEQEIRNAGEEIKQSFTRLINRQVGQLLGKLQSMKSATEKEVKSRTDAVQLALTELESFRTSSLELKSKGSPSDIVQAASDVRVRASELLQKHVIPAEYLAPSFQLTAADTDQLLHTCSQYVGYVARLSGLSSTFLTYMCRRLCIGLLMSVPLWPA